SGSNSQPSCALANRTVDMPWPPSPRSRLAVTAVAGTGSADHDEPPLVVWSNAGQCRGPHTTDPSTQPSFEETNEADSARNPAGTAFEIPPGGDTAPTEGVQTMPPTTRAIAPTPIVRRRTESSSPASPPTADSFRFRRRPNVRSDCRTPI